MKNFLVVSPVALAVLLAGCVTPQVTTPLPAATDIHQFKNVTLVVADEVNTPFSREGMPMFEGLLKGRLQSDGYTVVDTNAEMVAEVTVHEFSPGDRALRTLIGFGAGRAVLKYTAQFKDAHGTLLAELDGGKAYTGMELADNPTFKSDESTRMGLISYSVSQFGEFIESNGRNDQATGAAAPDRLSDTIHSSFQTDTGQPIPTGLPHPETWVYLGFQSVPGKLKTMGWVKPVALPPPQNPGGGASNALSQAMAQLFKPRKEYPGEWSESFEYQDFARPAVTPQEYLDGFASHLKGRCPSASVTSIQVSGTELLFEAKSGGCALYGDQDEIDCFLFGKTELIHMVYMVKSPEMTPEQREVAIKAVTTWKMSPVR